MHDHFNPIITIYICICIYVFAFVCELYHYLENASHDDGHIRTQIENITLLLSPAQSAPFLFFIIIFYYGDHSLLEKCRRKLRSIPFLAVNH